MRLSQKRKSFTVMFSSNLARKVTFAVFLALIFVEILVLIPSYMKRERELISRMEQLVEVAVLSEFTSLDPYSQSDSILDLSQHLKLENLLGLRLVEEDNSWGIGSIEYLSNAPIISKSQNGRYNSAKQTLDMGFSITLENDKQRIVFVRVNAEFIASELNAYLARITGLVFIISMFVTLTTMLVIWRLILKPIIKLEGQLREFTDLSDTQPDNSLFTQRADEIGTLFREFDSMKKRVIEARYEVERLAETDQLTGLNNRRKLDETMEEEIKRAKRYETPLSIIMCDLDHFKHVNDTYGHKTGDYVIVALAEIIQSSVRTVDIVGRWGGEEFLIICPGTDQQGAHTVAEKIRCELCEQILEQVGQNTASFGIAEYTREESMEAFLCRADKALYTAKIDGRNVVRVAA